MRMESTRRALRGARMRSGRGRGLVSADAHSRFSCSAVAVVTEAGMRIFSRSSRNALSIAAYLMLTDRVAKDVFTSAI